MPVTPELTLDKQENLSLNLRDEWIQLRLRHLQLKARVLSTTLCWSYSTNYRNITLRIRKMTDSGTDLSISKTAMSLTLQEKHVNKNARRSRLLQEVGLSLL